MPGDSAGTVVDPEEARGHADKFARVVASLDGGLEGEMTLGPEPLEVFDLTGVRLFYDFPLLAGSTVTGHVRAAADRRVAAAVVALERRPRRWDAGEALDRALAEAQARNPRANVARESARIVCYSYPKLAVQVGYTNGDGEPVTVLYDVATGTEVPITGLAGQSNARPYLARFADAEARVRAFEVDATALEEAADAVAYRLVPVPIISFGAQVWLAPECQDVLGVPLLGQITPINCVPE
jgi:hypothetical protein